MTAVRRASAAVATALAVLGAGVVLPATADPAAGGQAAITAEAPAARAPVPVRTLDAAQLRRGPRARIPFLQDGWVHVAGQRFRTGLPRGRQQVLLGRSGDSWLVANGRPGRLQVHVVQAGKEPVRVPRSRLTGRLIGVRASRDGETLVTSAFRRESSTFAVRRVSDGLRITARTGSTQLWQTPYDAADGHVLMQWQTDDTPRVPFAADWEVGVGERRLGSDLVGGFLRRDLVFLESPEGARRFGPTTVSAPGVPAWSARFAPLAVSPSGELVLGAGPRLVRGRQVLQVRRMSDGRVLQKFSQGRVLRPGEYYDLDADLARTARFEGDRRFVFELETARGAVLVRCTVAGSCARASRTGGAVSTTYEGGRWLR